MLNVSALFGGAVVDIPAWLLIVATTLGLVGTVAAAVAVSRQVAIRASLDSIIAANAELRADNDHLRTRLDDAAKMTANLEGKLEVFTSHFAEQIVQAVIETVERTGRLQPRSPAERTRVGDR